MYIIWGDVNSQEVASIFNGYFNESFLTKIARETGFVKRTPRKINCVEFLKLMVFSNLNTKDLSLDNLCEIFEMENKISLTKQSLDEKFDVESVEFVKQVLKKLLEQKIIETIKHEDHILGKFDIIRIKDSTCFKVSGNLSEIFKASGKESGDAIIKIQYEYDLRSGKIYDISLHSYIDQDTQDAIENLESINLNDLIIRDLGYISLLAMETIIDKGAYFFNRFDLTTNAYATETGCEKINFGKIQQYLKKNNLHSIEKAVFIGNKNRLPVRMVIERLPEKEIEKRIRKLKRLESRRKRKYSKEYMACLELNIYVTNIPKEDIDIKDIRNIYRLRWQIEIVFKTWKSIGKIALTKKMKQHRFEAMLYAKMMLLVFCQVVFYKVNYNMVKYENKSLSFYKTCKTLINNLKEIKMAIKESFSSIHGLFKTLIRIICKKCQLEKKKNTVSSMEIISKKSSLSI